MSPARGQEGGCEERLPAWQSCTLRAAPCTPHGQGLARAGCQAAPFPAMRARKVRRQPPPWKLLPAMRSWLSHHPPRLQPGHSSESRPTFPPRSPPTQPTNQPLSRDFPSANHGSSNPTARGSTASFSQSCVFLPRAETSLRPPLKDTSLFSWFSASTEINHAG